MTDLLADVVVYPDGEVRILDLDELSKAHETGLLTDSQLHDSLNRLHKLLSYIYAGRFGQLQTVLENLGL